VIPSFFSINGDGKNEEWIIYGGTSRFEVVIVNRWGKEVYKGTSQGQNFCKGEDLFQAGKYFFYLKDPSDNKKWNGSLMIVKL